MINTTIEQKDIKGILRKYVKYWYLFAICGLIGLGIAMVYLRYTTPMYMASATMLFKDDKGGGLSETSAFSDLALLNASKSIDDEVLVLKSRTLMESVVVGLQLDVSYVIEGQIRDIEIYGDDVPVKIIMNTLGEGAYNHPFVIHFKDDNSFVIDDGTKETHRFGQEVIRPYGNFTVVSQPGFVYSEVNKPILVQFHSTRSMAGHYSSALSIKTVNKQSSALRLGITDPIPERAKDILEKLIEVYDQAAVDDKNQIATKTVEFIDDRLHFLTQELTSVEQNVETYKQENELTDMSSQAQLLVAAASENRRELESINIQIDVVQNIERYLKSQAPNQYDIVPSTLTISDATLNGLIARYNELQLDRERQLRTARANNPGILLINDQLDNLKQNILENLKNIRQGLSITRRSLLAKSGAVGDQIQQVPTMDRQYLEITRQQEIKQAIYLYLLQKKEESALSLAAAVPNTRVIDAPESRGPVSPVRNNVIGYSILLGLIIPFLGIYVVGFLSNKVESKREVERLTKTPILGEICHSPGEDAVVTRANTRTPVSEMFRLIRSNLHFSAVGKENKRFLVTSSMSGEGKTFFCINMGTSLAGPGKKVLLIEFDLRRPMVLKRLGIESKKGLTDYLVGDINDVRSVILPSGADDNFDVIGAGTLPPNPAELMMNPKVKTMVDSLADMYDYIILDTPPIGKVADALSLKELADSSIYVVRYNYTKKDQLKIVDDIFVNQKLNNPLIVLNDAKKLNTGNYTYGY